MDNHEDTLESTVDPVAETAPAVDETASSEDHGDDVSAVADPAAHPSIAEAEAMFADNKGLASVLTDKGILTRDGVIISVPTAVGE